MTDVAGPTAEQTTVTVAGRTVSVAFRPEPGQVLAGGPLSLEVTISVTAGASGSLIAGAARATGRSREYTFSATTTSGDQLRDPYADAVEVGGVQTAGAVRVGEPVTEHILLNQFLTLEDLLGAVADGSSLELDLTGTRLIRFQEAPSAEPVGASATLHVTVHRDDAALAARYQHMADDVMSSPQAEAGREGLIAVLCTARNPLVVPALKTLTGHSDASVVARAEQALSAL